MIFLDAFSTTYMKYAPFLRKLSSQGNYFRLKPLFAFQGIGAAIFSGTSPNTNKIWSDYVYDPFYRESAMFSLNFAKLLTFLFDLIPNDNLSKYLRFVFCSFHNKNATPNLIPYNLIRYFRPRLRKNYVEHGALGQVRTLFDELRRHNIKYYVSGICPTLFEIQRALLFEEKIAANLIKNFEKDYRLYIVKFSSLDRLGHRFGPQSEEVRNKISQLDNILREVMVAAKELGEFHFIMFSDHGMSPVTERVNLNDLLHILPIKMINDYLVFVNSTVACFWFNNQKAREIVLNAFEDANFGFFLNEAKLRQLEIDCVGPEYYELMFALKEGYVFFPDFYRKRTPPRGMHGYAFQSYDSPFLLLYSPNHLLSCQKNAEARHIDIMPTVLDFLGVPSPGCQGESLLAK
jgi:predicted AlkP superfamily pyrophosphatase or phosphodiesterase